MFFKRKSAIARALKEFYKRPDNEKCQIDITLPKNGVVLSQVIKASTLSEKYKFSDQFSTAIISKSIPPDDLISNWKLEYLEPDFNRIIVLCNERIIDVEKLILLLIREDLEEKDVTLEMEVKMTCF